MALALLAGCRADTQSLKPTRDFAAVRASAADVRSPDGKVVIHLNMHDGVPNYAVDCAGSGSNTIVTSSPLGLTFAEGGAFGASEIVDVRRVTRDETYALPVGKTSSARDHCNEATVTLRERRGARRTLEIILRAYDDGVAFRYRIPEQPGMERFAITSEQTTFAMPADASAWFLPLPKLNDHYEYYYETKKVREIDSKQIVGAPLLMQLPGGGMWVAITEASLTNYAGMGLLPDPSRPGTLSATLAPALDDSNIKVRGSAPFATPWRVVMIGDKPGRLIESNLITNLNGPCQIADTSWIKPGKVSFLWWNAYVVGIDANGNPIQGGVDTETYNKYVDFAADNGIPYASLDGLDVAWYGGPLQYKDQDLTTGHAPKLDVQAVLDHAKKRGVRIRLWMDSKALRPQLDKALDAFEKWGVEGLMVDFIELENQAGVAWVDELVRKAAAHHLTISLHNVPKPTGLTRTWPNLLTYEAVRNEEWNKWSPGATPSHQVTVPFTRMLAGPLDFHSGGFRSVLPRDFKPRDVAPVVMGTRAHQVAMYVVYEDPLPMIVDYPQAYANEPGFEMLVGIPTVWDETRVLDGEVGQFITIARRKGDVWYVGSMAGDQAKELTVPLSFLGKGNYTIDGWQDGAPDQPNKPAAVDRRTVNSTDALSVRMSPAGGYVVRLTPAR